ncbi:MAG: hypothetical protein ABJC10_14490 [Acidobacteriota bacterium]
MKHLLVGAIMVSPSPVLSPDKEPNPSKEDSGGFRKAVVDGQEEL